MTPIRFIRRCLRAFVWFLRASLRALAASSDDRVDYDLSHRYAQNLSEGFKRIFRIRHVIEGAERLTAHQPCVYIANHRSNLDLVTMCEIFPPRTLVIGKREVLKAPLFGRIFRRGGNVAINRKDPDESRLGMEQARSRLNEEGLSIFMFPEGTRNYGRMLPFKKGAFRLALDAGVPLVPLVCAVTPGWLRGDRLFVAREVEVLIRVLDPIDPASFDSLDSLIEEARERMKQELTALESSVVRGPTSR